VTADIPHCKLAAAVSSFEDDGRAAIRIRTQ
jgi:hypothetical protein